MEWMDTRSSSSEWAIAQTCACSCNLTRGVS